MQTPLTGRSPTSSDSAVLGEKARAVDELVQRFGSEQAALLTLLVELAKLVGPLSEPVLNLLAPRLEAPAERLRELARAHRLLAGERPPSQLGLCVGGPCAARGGAEVERILREKGLPFEELRCQGACDLGPIACYARGAPLAISAARARTLAKAMPEEWEDLLSVEKPVHAFKTEPRVAFANIFAKSSHQLATARRHGVYQPVEQALKDDPGKLLQAVADSGLLGAGGEGSPAAVKWRKLLGAQGDKKYLVVNGVESEPGTFKDRLLLERDPHLVLAGALLAAYATGIHEAFLVVRAEYELATERARTALEEASRSGLLGERILGTSFALRLRVRLAPASYAAGEADGLVSSLEGNVPGRRAGALEEQGLFGRPTLVHNVETLAMLPFIAQHGGERFRGLGIGGAAGTKVVCLSGDLKRPGAYEVARGTSLRELLESLGGGPLQGKSLLAAQVGGVAGPFLTPEQFELGLDDAALASAGAWVGSGAVVGISEKSCLFDLARRALAFFAREGCGLCEGCKESLPKLQEAVEQLGQGTAPAAESIRALARQLRERPRCGVALRAPVPIESVLAGFWPAVEAHRDGLCVCQPRRRPKLS